VVLNTPSTKTYTVQNTGTSDLIVSAIDISGTDSASFAIGDITLPATIAAGDVATFTVTLTAGTSGVKSATVTISNDDCDEGAYTFSVQGSDSLVSLTGFISGDATVCAGSSTQLSIALTGQGPWSGTLSDGTVFSGSDNPLLATVNPTITTTYSIATLSSETATASAADLSGTATVTVTPLITYYADADGDGFGNDAITLQACSQPLGYAAVGGDCDDNNATIYPGAPEICDNSIDDNCNGQTDEGCVTVPITAPIGQISGAAFVACTGVSEQVYSITAVPNASTYTWVVTGGIQIASGQGTTQITANFPAGFTTGTLRVRASNSVSQTNERVLTIRSIPTGTPGAISGTTTSICANSSRTYSINPVGNTDSYEWVIVGSGASISGGQGTTSVSLDFATGFSSVNLQVRAVNSCGASGWRSLAISSGVSAMGNPGAITGPSQGCPLATETYSIPVIPGASSYTWRTTGGIVIERKRQPYG
jgi:large repetitive protein